MTIRRVTEDRRGIALIMVLWVLTVIALIAAAFAQTTRTEINLARNQVESAKAEALAEAGVYQAITGLSGRSGGELWRVDGTIYAWLFGGGQIRVRIEDEGGKIDLNAARDELLRGLFTEITLEDGREISQAEADALVDAILDFRDEDSLRRVSGAEDSDYRSAGLEYDAKDEDYVLVEELQQVLGMTREIYDVVAPGLTVHSRRRRPSSSTAIPSVRAALESGGIGEAIGGEEAELEGEEDTEDGDLDESDVISVADLTEVPQIIFLGPSSARSRIQIYTIHAEAQMPSGAVYALEAVTQITTNDELPYVFMAWRRANRELFVPGGDEEEDEDADSEG